jgi:outer membrane immunogenic protein
MHRKILLALALLGLAPAATRADDWSGVHLGAHLGYGRGRDDVREVNGPRTYYPDTRGGLGGVQAGWQRAWGRVIGGVEIEGGHLGQSGDVARSDGGGTVTSRAELGAYATLSGRFGYLLTPDWMLFGRLGATVAALDARTEQSCPGAGCTLTASSAATRRTAWGVTYGIGAERALGAGWHGRIEYQYVDFRRELALPADGGAGPGWNHSLDLHAVKLGVNYRF